MPIIHQSKNSVSEQSKQLKDLSKKQYTDDEIKSFNLSESINDHPLAKRPTILRSKLAYKEVINNSEQTDKYLLPGQLCLFYYDEPKFKESLEYYDRTPLTLFLGIVRTKDGVIREIGLNLHYYPPFARARILNHTYEIFKPWFDKNFNETTGKPNTFISYDRLKHIMRSNLKIGFGIKMYVPVLRRNTWLIPTRLFSTAYFTEGHFSKATMSAIFKFWRQF